MPMPDARQFTAAAGVQCPVDTLCLIQLIMHRWIYYMHNRMILKHQSYQSDFVEPSEEDMIGFCFCQ